MAVDITLEKQLGKLKKQKLRNNEYYDIQGVFDELYAKSVKSKKFIDLMQIISCENNILLAYRNIKKNKGSIRKGTDGRTIEHYKNWEADKIINYFQGKLRSYRPKSVRRVEIPKDYHPTKTRPLGIPCMDDRIIQQCIKQVLEPICEAKFHNHSYGFRPNRGASHAIARTQYLMWRGSFHYVVDIDIKGFFDNVNHAKLLKQMWHLGIQDKNLLCVIGKILKSEIKGIGIPDKGVPQGGVISPLLSNIVLNELDWWLSNQWETAKARKLYANQGNRHRVLKSSKLKQFYFVRYADDFKILCRDYKTAQKLYIAIRNWLMERLGLEISPEKSKITNVRKGKTEFLGFSLFVEKRRNEYITRSNISEKAKQAMKMKLKEQVKVIHRKTNQQEVNKLNCMILGMHGYYNIATLCSHDFREINYIVSKSLNNRLRVRTRRVGGKNKSPPEITGKNSRTFQKFYGDYKGKQYIITDITIFPIYGCKFQSPRFYKQDINNYTEHGRQLVHDKLNNTERLVKYLLKGKEYDKSVEYNDNRISLMAGQNGKCFVSGKNLYIGDMECHHKKPKAFGGTDDYNNLVWLSVEVHKLVHATQPETINRYLELLKLDEKALKKLNSLRMLAENLEIVIETT